MTIRNRVASAITVLAVVAAHARGSPPCASHWSDAFGYPGVRGNVRVLNADSTRLRIGGEFTLSGPVYSEDFVQWDGTRWTTLSGTGPGFTSMSVLAIESFEGATYVAGYLRTNDGAVANGVLRWDGGRWTNVGTSIVAYDPYEFDPDGSIGAGLAVYQGELYCGIWGLFQGESSLARWDGLRWRSLPNTPFDHGTHVSDMLVRDNKLYISGYGRVEDNDLGNAIFEWDGVAIRRIGRYTGGRTTPVIFALEAYEGMLVAGGDFGSLNGVSTGPVAAWDGTTWSSLNADFGTTRALAVYDGALHAATDESIFRLDGANWTEIWTDEPRRFLALEPFGDALYAGARSEEGSSPLVFRPTSLARWNGVDWYGFGEGLLSASRAICVHDGVAYVGGDFVRADGSAGDHVAAWNGAGWSTVGDGMNGAVNALCVFGGEVYAGGSFTTADGEPALHIARWTGSAWEPVGGGLSSEVQTLLSFDGQLIAGGVDLPLSRWNGTEWSVIPGGPTGGTRALTAHDGRLVAGGNFSEGSYRRLATWDGQTWSPLSVPITNAGVWSLASWNGDLYVGGNFRATGGFTVDYLGRWDGVAWHALGAGVDGVPRAILPAGDRLYVGGRFSMAGGQNVGAVAFWTGETWNGMNDGLAHVIEPLDPLATTLALAAYDGSILIGGEFETAGDRVSMNFAQWRSTHPDLDGDGVVGLGDISALLEHFGIAGGASFAHGDLNSDGDVDLDDLSLLLDAYGTTCVTASTR